MKKRYEKPMVYFEDMSFDTAIAQVCQTLQYVGNCNTNPHDELGCSPFQAENGLIFIDADKKSCNEGAFYCYHTNASLNGLASGS